MPNLRHIVRGLLRTPLFTLTAVASLALGKNPTLDDVKTALAGNLCRCTGYGAIYRAVMKWKADDFSPPNAASE